MASTPAYAVLLLGFGATDLSMTPSAIPRVRRTVTEIDTRDARQIAEECLRCTTADEVENLVRERFGELWYDLFPATALPAARQTS
jgi:phosphotransferase system enzyme I (PtsI)